MELIATRTPASTQVKEGYKQTEVGLIPADWNVLRLEEMGPIDSEALGSGTSSSYSFKYISLENVNDGKIKGHTEVQYHNAPSRARRVLRKNDIAFGTVRPNLQSHFLFDSDVEDFVCSTGFAVLRPIINKCSPKFIFQLLFTNVIDKQLQAILVGSNYPAINSKDFRNLYIPFPPTKEEQQAIATALSDVDDLITSLDRLIAKKKNIKQGAMQQLLTGKTRLPGFGEEWEEKSLGDLIDSFQNGYGFSAKGYASSGVPIVTMGNIGLDGSFNFNESKSNKWMQSDFNNLKSFHLTNGDLVIAMTDVTPEKNLIGRMAIVQSNQTLLLNQRVGLLRLDSKKVNAYLLKTISNMRNWRMYCIGAASLGVQANIGTKDILNGLIKLPKSLAEQNAIATILTDMDNEIEALEAKLTKYQGIKQGMMQELLTGKTRLV